MAKIALVNPSFPTMMYSYTLTLLIAPLVLKSTNGFSVSHGRPPFRRYGSIQLFSSVLPETVAPGPQTFAGMVEQAILDRFGSVPRVLESWRLLDQGYVHREFIGEGDPKASHSHQEAHSYLPGLTTQEFWDTDAFSWCYQLETKYPSIRQEFLAVNRDMESLKKNGNNIWAGALTEDAASYGQGWKTLVLMNRGMWDPVNVNLFPVTSQIIRDAPDFHPVEVFFASMQPRSDIQWHSDSTSFVLTSHLGLQIPGKDQCRLTIGDEEVSWENGKVLLFDTSIMHKAINESDEVRYILMFRVWHPDLSEAERGALQFIYNVLEFPDLLSSDADERRLAEQSVAEARAFPQVKKGTGRKPGFGSSETGKTQKSKQRKRR